VLEEFRVQTIQDATMRVIARKGLTEATMQDIADEAGIAKGTIYLYFSDRQQLLEQTVESKFSDLNQRMEEAFADEHGTFAERLTRIMTTHFGFFDENHEFFRVLIAMTEKERCSGERKRQHPRYRAYIQRLTRFFEAGIATRQIRECDPERLALFVAEGTRGLIMQRVEETDPPPLQNDIRMIIRSLFQGITERGKH
jgi:AcrR family transcriptional regulator